MAEPFEFFENSPFTAAGSYANGTSFPSAILDGPALEGYWWNQIDLKPLIEDIVKGYKGHQDYFIYNYQAYTASFTPEQLIEKERVALSGLIGDLFKPNHGEYLKHVQLAKAHQQVGKVETLPYFIISPNPDSLHADYEIYFFYAPSVAVQDGFLVQIEEIYQGAISRAMGFVSRNVALLFQMQQFWVFDAFINAFPVDVEQLIKEAFDAALQQSLSPKQRRNLLGQAPISYLSKFSLDKLYDYLIYMLEYDKNIWSDSDGIMIKLLQVIAGKEEGMAYLYNRFHYNPSRLKSLYENMSGTSKFNGQTMDNSSILASIVMGICYFNNQGFNKEHLKSNITFSDFEQFTIDTNIVFPDSKSGHFNIQQEVQRDVLPPVYQNIGKVYTLHPLDLVTYITVDDKGKTVDMVVPAIFVKDVADKAEWAEVFKLIRIGIDILLIALAPLTLGASSIVTFMAFSEAIVSLADIGIQSLEYQIRNIPGGDKFMDLWNTVYDTTGLVTAVVAIPELLLLGAKTLIRIKNLDLLDQFKTMLKHPLTQSVTFPRFVNNAFYIIEDMSTWIVLKIAVGMKKLANEGVLLLKGIKEGERVDTYFLSYKGLMIAKGDAKEITDLVKGIVKKKHDKIKEFIEKIYRRLMPGGAQGSAVIRGTDLGQALTTADLSKVKNYVRKYKTEIQIGPESGGFVVEGFYLKDGSPAVFTKRAAAAFFTDGKKSVIILRENATLYQLLHEFMHFRHCEQLGKVKYLKLGKTNFERVILRERYVFDKLMEYEKYLNRREMEHAQRYMNSHYPTPELQHDFSHIPNKRKPISIDNILKTK